MKKYVPALFMLVVLLAQASPSNDAVHGMIPDTCHFVITTAKLADFVKSVNAGAAVFLTADDRARLYGHVERIAGRTGSTSSMKRPCPGRGRSVTKGGAGLLSRTRKRQGADRPVRSH
jgi:hypothetical protein